MSAQPAPSYSSCEFLLTDAGAPGFASRKMFSAAEPVEVRDKTTQAVLHVRADEVSPYRHTLCVDGKPFRILRVLK